MLNNIPLQIEMHGPVPFHVFQFNNVSFLVDVNTHSILKIDEVPFLFFSELENTKDFDSALERTKLHFPASELDILLGEIKELLDIGFITQEPVATKQSVIKRINRLMKANPRNIMFMITQECNNACAYCYESAAEFHAPHFVDESQAKLIIDNFFKRNGNRGYLTITFFGGEPLLNFPLIEFVVDYSTKKADRNNKKISFTITTNATLIDDEIADFLVKHKFGVMVSLDGREKLHNLYRRDRSGNGTYKRAVKGLSLLLDKQNDARVKPLKLRATMTKENTNHLDILKHFRSNFKNARIAIGSTGGTAYRKDPWDITGENQYLLNRNTDRFIEQLLDCAASNIKPDNDNPLVQSIVELHTFYETRRRRAFAEYKICGVGRNMLAVTPQGDLYPCHRYAGLQAWNLGNVYRNGMDEALTRAYYEKLHDQFYTHCIQCWMRFRCGGPCPWTVSHPNGTVVDPDYDLCESIKAFEEKLIWLYSTIIENHKDWFHIRFESLLKKQAGNRSRSHTENMIAKGSSNERSERRS